MSEIPEGYQVGRTERRLLRELETFQRRGVPLLPYEFVQKMGLAGTSSIKRYMVLKAALHEYGWQSCPDRMRGSRPSLLKQVDLGPSLETEKLGEKLSRMQASLDQLTKREQILQKDLAAKQKELDDIRGLLMATISLLTKSDLELARRLDAKLLEMIRETTHAGDRSPAEQASVIDIRSRAHTRGS